MECDLNCVVFSFALWFLFTNIYVELLDLAGGIPLFLLAGTISLGNSGQRFSNATRRGQIQSEGADSLAFTAAAPVFAAARAVGGVYHHRYNANH